MAGILNGRLFIARVVKTPYQQTAAFKTVLATFLSYDGRPQYSRAAPPGHDSNRNISDVTHKRDFTVTEGVLRIGRNHEMGYVPRPDKALWQPWQLLCDSLTGTFILVK